MKVKWAKLKWNDIHHIIIATWKWILNKSTWMAYAEAYRI